MRIDKVIGRSRWGRKPWWRCRKASSRGGGQALDSITDVSKADPRFVYTLVLLNVLGLILLLLSVTHVVAAQTPARNSTSLINPPNDIGVPDLASVKKQQLRQIVTAPQARPGFLKDLTIDSFGYGATAVGQGFEFAPGLSAGPLTAHGMDCPRCIVRPLLDRNSRYTIPPFGAMVTQTSWSGHAELFGRFGGVNGWRVDNTGIEPGILSFRRDRSFNDAWLVQSSFGGRV
jgi:hypothetical protein